MHEQKVSVVLPAGGKGSRMGKSINKQYLSLQGMPILTWTWRVFARLPCVSEIFLVVAAGEEDYCYDQVVSPYIQSEPIQEVYVVPGGSERRDSVYQGLRQISDDCEYVIIHDGARPLINNEVIYGTLELAREWGAAIAGVPAKDTIKSIKNCEIIEKTLPREQLIQVQTPQIFKKQLILKAYQYGYKYDIQATDDSMLVEELGETVAYARGDYHNIKITTPEDMWFAEQILTQQGG